MNLPACLPATLIRFFQVISIVRGDVFLINVLNKTIHQINGCSIESIGGLTADVNFIYCE